MPVDKVTIQQFAQRIKTKYPEYKDINDTLLTQRMIAKYPEYKGRVQMDAAQPEQQEQPPITAKDAMAKYGITNQMPARESTIASQPQQTLQDTKVKETAHETEKQRKIDTPIAIENSTDLYFKNIGVKPSKTQREQKVNELKTKHDNDDLVLGYNSEGKPRMEKKLGGFAGFWEGAKEGFSKEGEARKFIDMSKEDRIKSMNEEKGSDTQFLPNNTDYTMTGGLGHTMGAGAPMMGKAITGAVVGGALAAAAPETGGLSAAGIAPTMAFLFSAPSAANVAYMDELKRRFKEGKQNGLSDDEAYHVADNQALVSEAADLATNSFLSRIPTSNASGDGVVNGLRHFVKNGVKTAGEFGGVAGGATLINELTAKTQGLSKDKSIGDIVTETGQSAKDAFLMGTALHVISHPEIFATLPKYLRAQYKGYLSKVNPEELGDAFQEMQDKGIATPEGIESAQKEIGLYTQANQKVPSDLPEDKEAAITGLIEKKRNLEKKKLTLDKSFHEEIDSEIASIDNRIQLAKNSNDPISREIDETGNALVPHKEHAQLKAEEKNGIVVPKEYGAAETEQVKTAEGEEKKYKPTAYVIEKQGALEIKRPIEVGEKAFTDKAKAQEVADRALSKHYYENGMPDNQKPQKPQPNENSKQELEPSGGKTDTLEPATNEQINEQPNEKVENKPEEVQEMEVQQTDGLGERHDGEHNLGVEQPQEPQQPIQEPIVAESKEIAPTDEQQLKQRHEDELHEATKPVIEMERIKNTDFAKISDPDRGLEMKKKHTDVFKRKKIMEKLIDCL